MDSIVGGSRSPSDCGEDRKPILLGNDVPGLLQMQSVLHGAGGHPSLIQGSTSSGSLHALPLQKGNVILFNNKTPLLHPTGVGHQSHLHQVLDTGSSGSGDDFSPDEDQVKKRREILARRPSYRKIFTELPGSELAGERVGPVDNREKPDRPHKKEKEYFSGSEYRQKLVFNAEYEKEGSPSSDSQDDSSSTNTSSSHHVGVALAGSGFGAHVLKVIPASAIQMAPGGGGQSHQVQTMAVANASSGGAGTDGGGAATVVQYRQNQEGQQFFVPVSVSPSDLQSYALQGGAGGALGSHQMVLSPGGVSSGGEGGAPEEATRKREVRLMKNREAARECRRKKKEYIKCLESRVAVLENQNKALIDELKTLKELYCQKGE